jgi:hypothetical protein
MPNAPLVIIVDKTPHKGMYWRLIDDDRSEKLRSRFYLSFDDCESDVLGLHVLLRSAGVEVTLRRTWDPPD